jgi:predicted nucleic acid-binding protein
MSGNKPRPVYYWDSNVFIAWLTGEQRADPTENWGLQKAVGEFMADESNIVTSTITRVEVFDTDLSDANKALFNKFLLNGKIAVVAPDSRICRRAHDLRIAYPKKGKRKQKNYDPGLPTPDAIHIATAIHLGVSKLHTFDNDHMLKKSGDTKVNGLIIAKPAAQQGELDLKNRDEQPEPSENEETGGSGQAPGRDDAGKLAEVPQSGQIPLRLPGPPSPTDQEAADEGQGGEHGE